MKAKIGVMSEELIRARMIGIAKGVYTPEADEPKVWYTSLNAVAQLLNPSNLALLRLMDAEKPETLTELAEISGRQKSNISATLKALSAKGFVRLEKKAGNTVKPIALFTDLEVITSQEIEDKIRALVNPPKAA